MKIKSLLLAATIFCASSFSWSQYMMMTLVEGQAQGKFRTESTRPGYSDKTEVLGFLMEVKSPRDVATGQASGKRQHQPITIWKASGASSPQFFKAVTTNEIIKTLKLEFYKPDDVFKKEELYYTIELENAFITGFRQLMGSPDNPEFKAKSTGLYDEIKIVFEKITVNEIKAKTMGTDNWNRSGM